MERGIEAAIFQIEAVRSSMQTYVTAAGQSEGNQPACQLIENWRARLDSATKALALPAPPDEKGR